MAFNTAKELLELSAAGTLISSTERKSQLGVKGLGYAIARGFEPFPLASTSAPSSIGVGRSGSGEISSNVSGFSGQGERSQRLPDTHIILPRLYGLRLVTLR